MYSHLSNKRRGGAKNGKKKKISSRFLLFFDAFSFLTSLVNFYCLKWLLKVEMFQTFMKSKNVEGGFFCGGGNFSKS